MFSFAVDTIRDRGLCHGCRRLVYAAGYLRFRAVQ